MDRCKYFEECSKPARLLPEVPEQSWIQSSMSEQAPDVGSLQHAAEVVQKVIRSEETIFPEYKLHSFKPLLLFKVSSYSLH